MTTTEQPAGAAGAGGDANGHAALATTSLDAATAPAGSVRLGPDPVSDDVVLACLEVADRAASGSPRRPHWIVVRDDDVKHQLARISRQGWSLYTRLLGRAAGPVRAARQWELDHFEDVPVVVVACLPGRRPLFPAFRAARWYAAVLPAAQNLLLAARAQGLGATLTTLPVWEGWEARRTLGLPWSVTPVAVVPLGWPREVVVEAARAPVGEVVHRDRWGHRPWRGQR